MIPLQFEPVVHSFDNLGSTNDKLKELALQGAPEGTLVFAKRQTKGRGRLGRVWHSPKGGFYVSVLLYPLSAKRITDLPFLVGVAITQSLQQILPKMIEVSLKWPNDVLLNKKKVGGILSEAFETEKFFGGIIGIGINVNTPAEELDTFQTRPFKATSVREFMEGEEVDLSQMFEIFKVKLFNLYRLYQEKGFAPIQALWEKNCNMLGKQIELQAVEPKNSTIAGYFRGLSDRGGLLLDISSREQIEIISGELTCCWY